MRWHSERPMGRIAVLLVRGQCGGCGAERNATIALATAMDWDNVTDSLLSHGWCMPVAARQAGAQVRAGSPVYGGAPRMPAEPASMTVARFTRGGAAHLVSARVLP
jgi:hypothetical protein